MKPWMNKLTLSGFKSIDLIKDFELKPLNILIGANGAGKSNFVSFFRLLAHIANESLDFHVKQDIEADALFFLGPKRTPKITAKLVFGRNGYAFELSPTADGRILINKEQTSFDDIDYVISTNSFESRLRRRSSMPGVMGGPSVEWHVFNAVSSWTTYHFHDTSTFASVRRPQETEDDARLRADASNIAAFLANLRDEHPERYELVVRVVRQVAPFIHDFELPIKKKSNGVQSIRLQWRQTGSNHLFSPLQLSDGTLRFICLAAALLQPDPPATIVIDEPELGLHPHAITLLGGLLRSAATQTQIVVSTQSPALVDEFEPEDVVTVNRVDERSVFQRLDVDELAVWLEDYSLGELWRKNVVRAGRA